MAALLVRPEHADTSDRDAARLCRVNKYLVRVVREELSAVGTLFGEAHADARDYKADAKLRGGCRADGRGGMSYDPGRGPPPARPIRMPVALPPDVARLMWDTQGRTIDCFGRPVPPALVDVFDERALFVELSERAAQLARDFEAILRNRGCASGLLPVRGRTSDLGRFRRTLVGELPSAVCPDWPEDDVGHNHPADCTHCRGKGWLTHDQYQRLSKEDKQLVGRWLPNWYAARDRTG